jgi:hypothetical protein
VALNHTCSFAGVDPLDCLTELHRHEQRIKAESARRMLWNYREQPA